MGQLNRYTSKFFLKIVKFLGNFFIFLSLFLLFLIFGPVSVQEVNYQTRQILNINPPLAPTNTDFSILIPKITASAPIIAQTDPFDKEKYTSALKKGVAHAQGSALPGQPGNVYLFAHSTDSFYNVGKYNAVFYLIGKLEKKDKIYIYYKSIKYTYEVTDKAIVNPEETKYLNRLSEENTLTLQTCYPPGTTFKRLIVIAKEIY